MKKMFVLIGNFGSGKTELALNLAFEAARTGKTELIDLIHQNADNGEQAADLLMAAKYFERIGDHATNIAEWVIFSITGKHKA